MGHLRPSHRPFWLWPLLGLAALVALLIVATWLLRPRQPTYGGRPLLAWVADLESPRAETRQAAQAAIQAVGADGIPALTWALRRGDSWLGRAVMASGKSLPRRLWLALRATVKPDEAPEQRATAAKALGLLGPAAEPAIGPLQHALTDPNLRVVARAAEALSAIGPAAVTPLASALSSTNSESRNLALIALGRMGPVAAPAAPSMVALLAAGDDVLNLTQASQALERIGAGALPALVAALASADPPARERIETAIAATAGTSPDAMDGLEAELRRAPPAIKPRLLKAVQQITTLPKRRARIVARTLIDPDPALREAAADWLRRNSSPEQLRAPLAGEPESLWQAVEACFRADANPASATPKPPGS